VTDVVRSSRDIATAARALRHVLYKHQHRQNIIYLYKNNDNS